MIISSLLDTDLYKSTMMQVVLHHFPTAQVGYRFKCHTAGVGLTPYVAPIRSEIGVLCQLRFGPDELEYLRGLRFIKSDFIDFLELLQLTQRHVTVEPAAAGNGEIGCVATASRWPSYRIRRPRTCATTRRTCIIRVRYLASRRAEKCVVHQRHA